ncbi:MAG TPA: DUF2254 domain-containing protein [Candidatus Nanopelagicales bacterium]|nr:DUF2254 domain-containing protein [Candidatus Nanopelagicales bacterium]
MTRFALWWERAFWVVPLAGVLLAMVLADLSTELDDALFADSGSQLISKSAATTMLSAVGGAMVTFTGFVFSLVLLLLQFGSSQYSPRTVAYFLRARSTQVILGIFLATSLFCFLTLLGVGSEGRDEFSPSASVLIATLLLVVSLIAFIALMHLVAKRIRIDAVVTALGVQTRRTLTRTVARLPRDLQIEPAGATEEAAEPHVIRYLGRAGQLVTLDRRRLARIARRHRVSLEVTVRVGDGIWPGAVIARASEPVSARSLSRALVVDGERSLRRDPMYGLRILVDVALKALSAAVNDPTTAVRCLDEIDGVLRACGPVPLRPVLVGLRRHRAAVPVICWPDVVDLGVREIRLAGLSQPQVTRRLAALLTDLGAGLPADRAACVQAHLDLLTAQVATRVDPAEVRFALEPDRQGIGRSRLTDRADPADPAHPADPAGTVATATLDPEGAR